MGMTEVIEILEYEGRELTLREIQDRLGCANGTAAKVMFRLRMRQQVNFRVKKFPNKAHQFVYSV